MSFKRTQTKYFLKTTFGPRAFFSSRNFVIYIKFKNHHNECHNCVQLTNISGISTDLAPIYLKRSAGTPVSHVVNLVEA